MMPRDREMGEPRFSLRHSDGARATAERGGGAVPRGDVVKSLVGGVLGGLATRFTAAPQEAVARKRKRKRKRKPEQPSTIWAALAADGSIVNSDGVDTLRTGMIGKGAYAVFVERDVSQCAITATLNVRLTPGVISVNVLEPTVLEVWTADANGSPTDLPFSLVVTC